MMGWRLVQHMFRPPHSKDPLGVAAELHGGKAVAVLQLQEMPLPGVACTVNDVV